MTELTTGNHWGGYRATVKDGKVTGLAPISDADEVSEMTASMIDSLDAPSRIRRPAVRESWLKGGPGTAGERRGVDPFVEVSWEKMTTLLSEELLRVRSRYGNKAIFAGSYGWASAGRFHHAQSQIHRFYNMFGGYVKSVNAYSFAAGEVILPHVITGLRQTMSEAPSWHEIAENTDLVVAFGGIPLKNAQIQNGGVGEHTAGAWIATCAEKGTQFIGISPIRDDMPEQAGADWIPIRPNSDTALMLALAHWLETNGHANRGFLDRYTVGYERFLPYLLGETDGVPKDAAWAEGLTGIAKADIEALAQRMTRGRVLVSLSWSLQRADHGEQPYWMGVVLAAMLGGIGLAGGGIAIGLAAEHGNGNPDPQMAWAAVPSGVNEVRDFIPVARISDMLLNPGGAFEYNGRTHTYPDVKIVHWAGGNPFHHHQDLNRLREAWSKPDTIIVQDIFWTAAARHADIVLPVSSPMERNDIMAAPLDGWALAMKKLVEPQGEARDDHSIFAGLAERLGFLEAFTEGRDEMAWLRHLWDRSRQEASRVGRELPTFEDFWEDGYLRLSGGPEIRRYLGPYRDDPEGNPLRTPSGRIEIYSEKIAGFGYAGIAGHPVWREPYEWLGAVGAHPLHLISNQPRTRLHSQLDPGAGSRADKIEGREPMRLNPRDAEARGLKDGDVARVFNDRGDLLAGVRIDAAVMPGVVQLATGAWFDPAAPEQAKSLDRHGNPNVLTADRGTSPLSQGPSAHTCLVEVERFEGAPPEVGAFAPPPMAAE